MCSTSNIIEQIGISQDKALKLLENKGIRVQNPNSSIKNIAKDHNTSPVAIYEILEKEPVKKQQSGRGYGWKTLENVAQEWGIPIQDIMSFLQSEGIEAEKDDVIRDVAEKNGMTPYELVEMIQKIKE